MLDVRHVNTKNILLILLLLSMVSVFHHRTWAQEAATGNQLQHQLYLAESYLVSYKNDSAILVSKRLLLDLKEKKQYDSAFGLRAQLVLARALEHNDHDTTSVRSLIHIKETCQQKGLWDTYLKACLALALLHENMGRRSQCKENLDHAKIALGKNNLDSLYPLYAMRVSSYHRIFTNQADSAKFYANELLRTAPKYNLVLEEAWGHMLMAMLLNRKDDAKSLDHFQAAIELFKKIDDYTGLSYALSGISDKYYRKGDLNEALSYNDSTIAAANQAIVSGNGRHLTIYYMYQFRGEIFRQLERPDSAWHYLKKGYEMELDFEKAKQNAQVIEIDARYQNEKKAEQIEEQAEEIQFQKERRNLWLVIFIILLLLVAALLTGLYKHRIGMKELTRQNELIQQQAKQLKHLDFAKSRFFANVSHELRTPLTLMLSPIKTLLKENQLSEKQIKLLQMANQSGKQLNQLINEILDLRKLEMGKMEVNPKPTNLSAFFGSYAAQFESLALRQGVDFSIETQLLNDPVANIDREKCRQILYNLLSNAFKFTPAGGAIEMELELEKATDASGHQFTNSPIHQFHLTVSDTGPGIHAGDVPHVFDRFFQTSRPYKPAEGGTGIGLALCKEYAQLFGGTITVKSTVGQGSVFRVTFPVTLVDRYLPSVLIPAFSPHNHQPISQQSHEPHPNRQEEKKPVILVVEDNPGLQDYMHLILSEKYHIVTAGNGQEALEVLQSGSPQFSNYPRGRKTDWRLKD